MRSMLSWKQDKIVNPKVDQCQNIFWMQGASAIFSFNQDGFTSEH